MEDYSNSNGKGNHTGTIIYPTTYVVAKSCVVV